MPDFDHRLGVFPYSYWYSSRVCRVPLHVEKTNNRDLSIVWSRKQIIALDPLGISNRCFDGANKSSAVNAPRNAGGYWLSAVRHFSRMILKIFVEENESKERLKIHTMKTILILLFFASIATATPPTSRFGTGTITRTPSGNTYVTQPFGNGTITRDSSGKTWTTGKFGNGTITRGPGGSTHTTSPFGKGTITRGTGTPPPVIPAANKPTTRK